MELKETKAVLLKKIDVKESDALYIFYSELYGKIKLYRKGARARKSRFASGIEPYNILAVRFRPEDREILNFSDFAVLSSSYEITGYYEKYILYSMILEIIEKLTADRDGNAELYRFLAKALVFITGWDGSTGLLLLFNLIKLTQLFGISPGTAECMFCKKECGGNQICFSLEGGICCTGCALPGSASVFTLTSRQAGLISLIKKIRYDDLGKIDDYTDEIVHLIEIFVSYIKYHFNIDIKSLSLIGSIEI